MAWLIAVEADVTTTTSSLGTVALRMAYPATAVASAVIATSALRTIALHVARIAAFVTTTSATTARIALGVVACKAAAATPAVECTSVTRGLKAVAAAPCVILSTASTGTPIVGTGCLILLGLGRVFVLAVALGVLVSSPVLGLDGAATDLAFSVGRLNLTRLAIRIGDQVESLGRSAAARHCSDSDFDMKFLFGARQRGRSYEREQTLDRVILTDWSDTGHDEYLVARRTGGCWRV
jgi:hypothetical protein